MGEDINIKDKKIIVIVLLILLCISVFGGNKIFSKSIKNDNQNNMRNKEVPKEQFAMYIKNASGNYDKYDGKDFPDGYKVNLEKSSCEDANGNTVNGAISMTNGKPTVTSNKTIYCTFYMDEKTILDVLSDSSNDSLNPTEVVEDELAYRYNGNNDNVTNYLCFGTKDKSECIENKGIYMYRIIGIDKFNRLKVIKKEVLDETMIMYDNVNNAISWPQSIIYSAINGDKFLNNTVYVPNLEWSNKIELMNWKYGALDNIDGQPNVHGAVNISAAEIVQKEQGFNTVVKAKIGLIYISDYCYGLNKEGNNCSVYGEYVTCRTNWINFFQNHDYSPQHHEWFMTYFNGSGGWSFGIVNGSVQGVQYPSELYVRPVFYLIPEIELSGSGSQTDPFIITN